MFFFKKKVTESAAIQKLVEDISEKVNGFWSKLRDNLEYASNTKFSISEDDAKIEFTIFMIALHTISANNLFREAQSKRIIEKTHEIASAYLRDVFVYSKITDYMDIFNSELQQAVNIKSDYYVFNNHVITDNKDTDDIIVKSVRMLYDGGMQAPGVSALKLISEIYGDQLKEFRRYGSDQRLILSLPKLSGMFSINGIIVDIILDAAITSNYFPPYWKRFSKHFNIIPG